MSIVETVREKVALHTRPRSCYLYYLLEARVRRKVQGQRRLDLTRERLLESVDENMGAFTYPPQTG